MSTATELADRMRALAKTGTAARALELTDAADAFDAAAKGFYSEPQTHTAKQMMGAWARARRVWCECTGEALI